MLPSHNCIIIDSMFSFQGTSLNFRRNSMKFPVSRTLQSISLVEISGIEPLTSCLQGRRSPSWAKPPYSSKSNPHLTHLPCVQAKCFTVALFLLSPSKPLRLLCRGPQSFLKWWAKMDSNHRPHDYQSCALASWAIGPYQLHFLFRYIF